MIELHDYLLPWLTLMGVQVIATASPETPVQVLVLYGASDVFIETFWFAGLSVFLTYPLIQQRFLRLPLD